MPRLFVALRPPPAIRTLLLGAMGGISGARWQRDDQFHLTLRFIGAADRHQAEDIAAALGAVRQDPFQIALHGIGTFERRGVADTVWAGVTPHAPLQALHKKVDAALLRVGVEPDHRAFLPHITLARLNRTSGPVGHLLEGSGALGSPGFLVDRFGLFESDLTPDGAVYSSVARYPLN